MKKYILPIIILTVITLVTLGCANHNSDDYITFAGDAPGYGGDAPGYGGDVPGSGSGEVIWEGSGTVEDPYLVPDADHLDDIRNKSMSACYKQTAHINLKKTRIFGYDWQPIGERSHCDFTGKYDGNGYRIVGLFVKSDDIFSGLFGGIQEAEINNLIIEEAEVVGTGGCVGIFVGRANGKSIIRNCYALNSTVNGDNCIGGIVGIIRGATVINCRVDHSDVSGDNSIGGIVGSCIDLGPDKAIVDNCYVNDSKVNGNISVGAITGDVTDLQGGGYSFVRNCFACGDMVIKGAKLSSETDGLIEAIKGSATVTAYYWKDGYKQGTTTGWTDWDPIIWNIPSTVPCLPTLRVEQEPPSEEWYKKSGGLVPPKEPQMQDQNSITKITRTPSD